MKRKTRNYFGLSLLMSPLLASAATLNVPGSYPTIQSAVTAAASGDTIQVAAGTYNENVDLTAGGKAGLQLVGAGAASLPSVPFWGGQ
jgi:pectin methylesterase-like acyl-CoA thioesterase